MRQLSKRETNPSAVFPPINMLKARAAALFIERISDEPNIAAVAKLVADVREPSNTFNDLDRVIIDLTASERAFSNLNRLDDRLRRYVGSSALMLKPNQLDSRTHDIILFRPLSGLIANTQTLYESRSDISVFAADIWDVSYEADGGDEIPGAHSCVRRPQQLPVSELPVATIWGHDANLDLEDLAEKGVRALPYKITWLGDLLVGASAIADAMSVCGPALKEHAFRYCTSPPQLQDSLF